MMSGEFDYLLQDLNTGSPYNEEKDPQPEGNDEDAPNDKTPAITVDDAGIGIAGLESLSYGEQYAQLITTKSTPVLSGMSSESQKSNQLNIRTTDGKHFRIWLRAQHWFTSEYINRLCRFLDSRSPDEGVTLYVGCKLEDRQTCIVGAIISSIIRCQCPVRCVATGYCGVPETMLFAFCKEREIRKYGALSIGGTIILTDIPMYKAFYEAFYDQMVAIRLITEEERKDIWEYNKEIIVFPEEYYKRVASE